MDGGQQTHLISLIKWDYEYPGPCPEVEFWELESPEEDIFTLAAADEAGAGAEAELLISWSSLSPWAILR